MQLTASQELRFIALDEVFSIARKIPAK